MAKNREKAQNFIMQFMADLDPSGYNASKYKIIFDQMSDKDFDSYMKLIKEKKAYLVAFKPLYRAKGITIENNLKIAPKYSVQFFEKLLYTKDNISYKTPIEYLVVTLPYRRQSQTLVKKASIPEHNKVIDQLTYQPTGDSKGSKISYPELLVLTGMGLDYTIEELFVVRAGDKGAYRAYNAMFSKYASASVKTVTSFATGAQSTKTLKTFLAGMHLKTTI
jgi:hypothetical protein